MRELPMTPEQSARYGTETMPLVLADNLTHNGEDFSAGEEVVAPIGWVKAHSHLTQVGKNIEAYAASAFRGMGTTGETLDSVAKVVRSRGGVDPMVALEKLGIRTRGTSDPDDKLPRIRGNGSPSLQAAANVRNIKQLAIEESARAKDGGTAPEEN